jgi:hypothetical protein
MKINQITNEGMLDNPGQEDSPVAQAIIRRILLQRTDLLAKHGPERVGAAVDEVADFVGDVDEIGSSDVSGWVRHVEQMLGNMEQGLNEFAPDSGSGESGRWYTDDQMTDIVGDGWWQDLDISGAISKQAMIQEAQAWLDDQGYSVQVLNVKVNDDDTDWFIQGSFDNPGFANEGMAEGSSGVSVRQWANQVRKDHGPDVKFRNRQEGGGAVDSVIAKNSQGETVGVYNRKTGYPTVYEPKQDVAEGYQFKGPFPFDVDHMHGGRGINLPKAETKKYFTDKKQWQRAVDDINSSKYDDNSDYIGVTGRSTVEINGREWARWSDAQQKGYIELSSMSEQGVAEGEKVGNMDADAFDAAMARLKKLAGSGPMKTVYDPAKRVYRNVPTAVQPKK